MSHEEPRGNVEGGRGDAAQDERGDVPFTHDKQNELWFTWPVGGAEAGDDYRLDEDERGQCVELRCISDASKAILGEAQQGHLNRGDVAL